ncbi:MAG: 50S ribosomal protein L3 [Oscillospiraceae bacterium]|nr:50S ribosomal protein L3 [Oscillospiraceae bacterium]
MSKGIIGKKLGMTQLFDPSGNVIPVTVVQAGPCPVTQIKTLENDGYDAVQLGFEFMKATRVKKPQAGHFKKADVAATKTLREFRLNGAANWLPEDGKPVTAEIFETGEIVDVTGTSKGKGTAGAIKRWNFSRIKETHGSGPVHRHAGSMGACSDPSRVFKGKKNAGRMGNERVTIQNLTIVKIDSEHNLIAVKGAVPGPKNGVVLIRAAIKKGGGK